MKLSHKHQKAVAALLTSPTHEAAAKAAGCSRRSLQNWLNDPDFRAALQQAEEATIAHAARSIGEASKAAVQALREVLNDPDASPAHTIAAANSILAHLPRLRLLGSLEARLIELEQNHNDPR